MMRESGVYRDTSGRTVVAERWDGGEHPDVRQSGEGCAMVVSHGEYMPIMTGDWIVTSENSSRRVWSNAEFRSVFEGLLRVPV